MAGESGTNALGHTFPRKWTHDEDFVAILLHDIASENVLDGSWAKTPAIGVEKLDCSIGPEYVGH